ncbi:MAG: hypothetical protein IJX04_06460 [Oscillospiraceae bacterium]|nr:hypothetical protein [Oscillospiraceae bacterium]
MELLKRTMLDVHQHLNRIAQQLHSQKFLSEQDFLGVLGMLDQLRREQKRCVAELAAQTGMELGGCTSVEQLEQCLAEYQAQCQQRIREEQVLALAGRFGRIVGEGDYGFALEPFQKKILELSAGELLKMEEAGGLEGYQLMLELIAENDLSVQQVEPIGRTFNFHVAFGLLGGKYACMKDGEAPDEIPPAKNGEEEPPNMRADGEAQVPEAAPVEEAVPEALPEQEIPTEAHIQVTPEEDQDREKQAGEEGIPLTELPAMVVEGGSKKPKGESAFVSIWKKNGMEQGIAFQAVAYMILEDWGCRQSVVNKHFQNTHSKPVVDRAIAMLIKEGFLASYRLEGEGTEDLFYHVTKSGYQILNKEALQRKVRGRADKYGYPEISNVGVFTRLRRMNEINQILGQIPDASVTRTIERGFCGNHLFPQMEHKLLHFPMLYTCEDKLEDVRRFFEFFKEGRGVTEQTAVLLEVPEGQQAFWRDFFIREFSDKGSYYVSAWGQDRYEDSQGDEWTLEELLAPFRPQEPEPDDPTPEAGSQDAPKASEHAADAASAEEKEAASEALSEYETEAIDLKTDHVEPEQLGEQEPVAEALPRDAQFTTEADMPDAEPDTVAVSETTEQQEDSRPEAGTILATVGLPAKEQAQMLMKLAEPDGNADALMELIRQLVAEGQTMEALVLAKALAGASKDARFRKIGRDLLHGSNLPLQERDYSSYVMREDAGADTFGWYSLVSSAFWAACFPKMAYDYNLYYNISGMVETGMESRLPEELVDVRNAMALLTGELKTLSFDHGDGAGLSAGVLDSLASGTVLEQKRQKLMASARDKIAAPRSTLSLTGFETVMKTMMGPAGELGPCMLIVAEDQVEQYDLVERQFRRFVGTDGLISEKLLNDYIDGHWDALRKTEPSITTKRLKAPARPTLHRELTRRLEIMDEWLKRNAPNRTGKDASGREAFRALVGKLQKYILNGCKAIDRVLAVSREKEEIAGLALLKQSLMRIYAIVGSEMELAQDPKHVFADLLTTQYPVLDTDGYPILDDLLNALPGMEPWRLLLQHLAADRSTLEEALLEIEDHELHSVRYEDFGSAAVIRSALKLPQEDHALDDHYARNGCMDQEESFMGEVRLACAYGQLAEEDKETFFAQLSRYRSIFVPEWVDSEEPGELRQSWGNYAHYRMMIECLKQQVNEAKVRRRKQFWKEYERLAQRYPKGQIPGMLRKACQELEKENLATAEEYLLRVGAGIEELPQEGAYAAEFNFHHEYLQCADWYCSQCEKPENKNMKPKDWGRRVLQNKNFWSASNEKNSAESILENWPTRKGDGKNPAMLRQFLGLIGLPVQQVFPDGKHPATNQYEVFVAGMKPMESGREDYSHPVAKFGTLQNDEMYIVCLYGCKGAATLIDIMTKKLQLGGNTIVVMDGVVNVLERRRVAAQFKTMTSGQNGFLLIDRVLMLYLAAQDSGNRLNAMLQCTMPYIYDQLYTEGAGTVADEMFVGRIAERKSLCDPNGTCLVYGGRQLGKTALLRRVESINNKPADQRYAIYVDIKEVGRTVFIQRLRDKLMTIQTDRPLLRGDEQDLEQICASLLRSRDLYRQLTILIDEVDTYFEEIAPNNYNDIHPVVVLQDETKNKVKFVFAGTHNVAATAKAIEDNADIVKLRQPLCIKPLSPADAMRLIRWPLSYLGFEIGEQQIAMILANTNSYPGLIHLFCNSLVKSICDNYSKYYDAGRGNPPYTVSDEQMRAIFREKDIKREIARRVIATIKVNRKYRVVSNLIAFLEYQDQLNGTTRLYGYTPEEVQRCNEIEAGIEDFLPENMDLGDLDTLMYEMVEMGILWKNPKTGSYRFRQRDFLGYVGNYNEVLKTLLGGV